MFYVSFLVDKESENMIPSLIFVLMLLSVEVSMTTATELISTDEPITPTESNINEIITEPGKKIEITVGNKTNSTEDFHVGYIFNTTTIAAGFEPNVDSIVIPEGTAHLLSPNLLTSTSTTAEDPIHTINSSLVDPEVTTLDSLYAETATPDSSYPEITSLDSTPEITSSDNSIPEISTPESLSSEFTTLETLFPESTSSETIASVSASPESFLVTKSSKHVFPNIEELSTQTEITSTDDDISPATTEDTSPATTEDTSPATTEDISPSTTEDTSPATTEDISPATTEDTSPATTENTSPATTEDTSPATTEDTSPATTEDTSPATTEDISPATTEDTSPATTEDSTSPMTFSTEYSTSPETTTEPPDDGVNTGLVIGIILAILLIGVGIVLWRAYSSGRNLWPPKNLFSNGTPDSIRPQPVPLKKFPAHCNEMLDVPSKLSHEFHLLATLSVDVYATESFVAGLMPDNKYKNRYVNILPFDSTRVKLSPEKEDEFYSDYVNASYIKGYTNDIEYIATQGPKEETCRDFWKMVYQEPIKVIVMVTQLEEQGKAKCYKYFPNFRENMDLEDIVVWCSAEVNFPIYTSRTLILTKGERKRSITHLHFREWPDFGCPATPELMLQFCQVMRHNIISQQPGITLIHCSAGVGRTGTLIAVDILLQHIKENKKIDIFGTVYKLRKHRMNMVQSEAQYVYLYKCIKEALEDPSYLSSENSSTTSLEPIYENIECARLTSIPSKDELDTVTSENECAL